MSAQQLPASAPLRKFGRYVLFEAIAGGGMATVHLGRLQGDAGFARTVAIKRLRTARATDQKLVTMFVDEARLAGRVQHPNVVGTLDVVVDEKEIFLIMEYVHGESLKVIGDAWGAGRPFEPRVACTIATGALHGLHAAHEAKDETGNLLGLVHRDVSPQNILLGADGIPRVVDFGVAKAAGRLQSTQTGQLKGKPRYMAPEQLIGDRSATVDRRTDVWSLAIVLWEMLTGERLFSEESDLEVYRKVVSMPIPSPHEVNSEVPLELSGVVMKGLERAMDRRFATARAFARALDAVNPRGLLSQDALGEWVQSLVGPRLAKRERRIRGIETATPSAAVAPDWSEPDALPGDTDASTERVMPPGHREAESPNPPDASLATTTRRQVEVSIPTIKHEPSSVANDPLFPADAMVTTRYQRKADPPVPAARPAPTPPTRAPGRPPPPAQVPGRAPPPTEARGTASPAEGALFGSDEEDKTLPLSMSKLRGAYEASAPAPAQPLFPAEDNATVPLNMSKYAAQIAAANATRASAERISRPELESRPDLSGLRPKRARWLAIALLVGAGLLVAWLALR